MSYKSELIEKGYAVRSVNSMLASLNSLFDFLGWSDCRVKTLKTQHQTYCAEEKELTKAEYTMTEPLIPAGLYGFPAQAQDILWRGGRRA